MSRKSASLLYVIVSTVVLVVTLTAVIGRFFGPHWSARPHQEFLTVVGALQGIGGLVLAGLYWLVVKALTSGAGAPLVGAGGTARRKYWLGGALPQLVLAIEGLLQMILVWIVTSTTGKHTLAAVLTFITAARHAYLLGWTYYAASKFGGPEGARIFGMLAAGTVVFGSVVACVSVFFRDAHTLTVVGIVFIGLAVVLKIVQAVAVKRG